VASRRLPDQKQCFVSVLSRPLYVNKKIALYRWEMDSAALLAQGWKRIERLRGAFGAKFGRCAEGARQRGHVNS
jgi:hypothetical protein